MIFYNEKNTQPKNTQPSIEPPHIILQVRYPCSVGRVQMHMDHVLGHASAAAPKPYSGASLWSQIP